jgi:hypothetical protein
LVADATVTDPGPPVGSNRYQKPDPTNLIFGINRYKILSRNVGFYKGRNKGMPPMIQLTGQDLLQHRENCRAVGMAAADIVRAAGYIGQRKDGSEKLNFTRYYEEVLIAQGKMHRVNVYIGEITPMGIQPVQSHSFTTSSKSARSVSRKVREITDLTGVRCKRIVKNGVVRLYPKSGEVIAYNVPA